MLAEITYWKPHLASGFNFAVRDCSFHWNTLKGSWVELEAKITQYTHLRFTVGSILDTSKTVSNVGITSHLASSIFYNTNQVGIKVISNIADSAGVGR